MGGWWGGGNVGALMVAAVFMIAMIVGTFNNGVRRGFTCGRIVGKGRIRSRVMCGMRGNGFLRGRLGCGFACSTRKHAVRGRTLE